MRLSARSLSALLPVLAVVSACAAPEAAAPAAPAADARPVPVKFTRLVNPELNRRYRGARVRTTAAFSGLFPLTGGERAEGWLGAIMYAAKRDEGRLACDSTRTSTAGGMGLVVVAPTDVGDPWADAENGTVFQLVGMLYGGDDVKVYPWGFYGPGRKVAEKPVYLEVEGMEPLGRCEILNGWPVPVAPGR